MELAELLAIPVLESAAFCVNFPGEHPLHAGYQFTTSAQNQLLAEADVILVLDSDVPWIHATNRPSPAAAIYAVDVDPLKAGMSMWHIPARRIAAADSKVAVEQITRFVRDDVLIDAGEVETRRLVITAAGAGPAGRARFPRAARPRRDHAQVPDRVRARAAGGHRRAGPDRGDHQLPSGGRAPAGQPSRIAAGVRRRFPGLGGRRRRRG